MAKSAGVVYTGSAGDEPGAIMELYDFARSLGFEVVVAGKGKNNPLDLSATPSRSRKRPSEKRMNPKMLASFVDGTKTMVEMAAVANATASPPTYPACTAPRRRSRIAWPTSSALREDGGLLSGYGVVDYVRGVAPGVFVIVRSPEGRCARPWSTWDRGAGPNHVFYRPYHLTSLETPISVARAAIYGEPTIVSPALPDGRGRGRGEAGPRGRRETRRHRLRRLLRLVVRASEAKGMLPLGIAAGARITQPVARGQAIPRSGVELAEDSFAASLRRLQETA